MKKIIYLSNSIIPSQFANSVHVMKMCQAFRSNSFDVQLLFYTKSKKINDESIFLSYGINKKFKLIPMHIKSTKKKFFQNIVNIYRFLNKNDRKTIVYGRDIYSVYLASLMGFDVYFESHGKPFTKIHEILERNLYKKKKFKELIVISSRLKEIYIKDNYFIKEEKISVLHDGADSFDLEKDVIDLGEGFHIGYIGSLYYEGRGIDLILNLAKENQDLNFHLIGGKKDEIHYWKTKSTNNIKFHGFLPNNEAISFLTGFDVVLMPYQKDLNLDGMKYNTSDWMSPMKMFEYMSASKAIISSDLPVIREVLNNENSVLVEYDNKLAWNTALRGLHNNQDHLNKISIQASYDFNSKYTWNKRVQILKSSMENSLK